MRSIALLAIIMAAAFVQPAAAAASDSDPADPATLDRGAHPGSIGFADPDDLSALLGYRLPDWGWRAWVIDGSFHGRGHTPTTLGTAGYPRLDYAADLQTEATWYRESEPRSWGLSARLSGDWARQRADDLWTLLLDGRYRVTAHANQYLLDDRWFVSVRARTSGGYREHRVEQPDGAPEDVVVQRLHDHEASLRLGWGRIRDVTPLVRAQRLAERLVAMDRPRLGLLGLP